MIVSPAPSRFSRHRRPLALATLCGAAVCALALAGCGAANIVDPVAKAANASAVAPGYRVTLSMQMSSPVLPAPITAAGGGRFNVPARSGAFSLRLTLPNLPQVRQALGGSALSIDEVLHGNVIYLKAPPALRGKLPGARPWLKIDLSRASAGLPAGSALASPLSSDPSQYLGWLRAVSGSVTKVGTGTVAGFPTTHYRTRIDLERVADRVAPAQRAAARQAVQRFEAVTQTKQLPVDVWIDNSHLVRRLALNTSISIQGVALTLAVQETIPEYGPQPSPTVPPAAQVTDASALRQSGGAASF